ncbi:xanthine dehydrogenase family protein molybdopterin-binding subunit [Micromonospora parathelypteridis]|uniref:Xanthine dehydrogenase YagR molybdenum-binding subunit n=1 Tax=Micromonospora parathelypteridis TaxID=1839617 RepID=A0A840VIA9_9ACTN|nr:xanthine dehydrogenase family protein molybdopterin-binding subunit [Micromonospora parathelypteridis]MBB5476385.1 xanthine dehydrogenase YagR molybdenum-binding subunit [Micromonospora parathelypteridis]GGO14913.1 carbon-monoxide dehydrogenase large subunit [Micromonospora parathelypteridis]
MSPAIGGTLNRVDGRAKVRGDARYSAEVAVTGLVHAVLVNATVASGRITAIDTAEAERADGVLAVFTHRNLSRVASVPPLLPSLAGLAAPGQTFFPMQDEVIHYSGQPIAIVVADTVERADHAGTLIRVEYAATPSITLLDQARDQAYVPERIFGGLLPGQASRGDVAKALAEAQVCVDATYRFAPNHHNPIEPSASTAVWEDVDRLTIYDSTQGPNATQFTVAALLGLPPISIRVVSHAVGGSFGSKAMIWHHPALAALAARQVGRPVQLALTREQMFTSCGHREEQEQRITIGAGADGRITALRHHKLSLTSRFDDWAEPSLQSPAVAYTSPHYEGIYHLVRGNTITPTFMRAPGEATGMFALECAMDELAEQIGIDPLELRLRNYSDADPESGNPWSSSGLKECYQRASELFGWRDRDSRPRREDQWLIGSGMASALYPVTQPVNPQRARARLYNDGTAVVEAGVSEFGTGVFTAMTQVAADALGLPVERVRFVGGSSDLPNVTAAVGSAGTSAVGSAVHLATTQLRDELIRRAVADAHSPLHGADPGTVVVQDGRMALRDRPDVGETYADMMARTLTPDAEVLGTWTPPPQDAGYGLHTFGAQMAEVAVDADLGVVRVRRMVGVFAPGRVLNRKTAHSQLMGGMLWGLGQALLEATRMDPRSGRWANASLGDYLVAVNADAPDVVVDTVEVHDEVVNPLGMKGVGEIGVVGAAAAIANAVHDATGRRQYELPITLEKLL